MMKQMILSSLLCLSVAGCASTTKNAPFEVEPEATLNYVELQNRLGVQIGAEQTGFREKSFEACDLGRGLNLVKPPLADCHHAHFILVQFQLSCRPNEESSGTLTENDLTPVGNRKLKWQIGKLSGNVETDFQGRGVIRGISSTSLKKAYLRISTGVDFLNMRVEQATAIVTPPSWCGLSR